MLIVIPVSFADNSTQDISNSGDENSIYVATDGDDTSGNGSSTSPYASVSKAVESYNSSVNSNIFVKNGNYNFTERVNLNKNVTILGESAEGVILNGNNNTSLFEISGGSNVALKSLSLVNGFNNTKVSYSDYPGSAIYITYGKNVTVDDCIFSDNKYTGAITSISTASNLTISNSVFENNTRQFDATSNGGAIVFAYGTLNIYNTTFRNNSAKSTSQYNLPGNGGAIYLYNNVKLTTIDNCTFVNNTADQKGGAISAYYGGDIVISNSSFINNTAGTNGSAIYDEGGYSSSKLYLNLSSNTFLNNIPSNSTISTKGYIQIVDTSSNTRISAPSVSMSEGQDKNFTVTLLDEFESPLVDKSINI